MNTYLISYEIFFNGSIVGKAVEDTQALNVVDALEKLRVSRTEILLKEINKEKIVKGDKPWTAAQAKVLLVPICIFTEETDGNNKQGKKPSKKK